MQPMILQRQVGSARNMACMAVDLRLTKHYSIVQADESHRWSTCDTVGLNWQYSSSSEERSRMPSEKRG